MEVYFKLNGKEFKGIVNSITSKGNLMICCKPDNTKYRVSKDMVYLKDKSPSISISESSDDDDDGIPFSSIQGCGHIDFSDSNLELIKKDSFLKGSKYFKEITTDDDGNCGYHSLIQGLIESYYILGDKSNDNLKQFISNIQNILKLDPKKIAKDNRTNNKISIPRVVINHFRRFILDLKAPPKLRVPMQDGTLKHVYERPEEVAEYPYDSGKGQYLKRKDL